MILRQRVIRSDGMSVFDWSIEPHTYSPVDGKVRVGSFAANYWCLVKRGKTDKQTLGYAKQRIRAGMHCISQEFEYVMGEW